MEQESRKSIPWLLLLALYAAGAYRYSIAIKYVPPLTAFVVMIFILALATVALIAGWREVSSWS
jgi:hypothetical protein